MATATPLHHAQLLGWELPWPPGLSSLLRRPGPAQTRAATTEGTVCLGPWRVPRPCTQVSGFRALGRSPRHHSDDQRLSNFCPPWTSPFHGLLSASPPRAGAGGAQHPSGCPTLVQPTPTPALRPRPHLQPILALTEPAVWPRGATPVLHRLKPPCKSDVAAPEHLGNVGIDHFLLHLAGLPEAVLGVRSADRARGPQSICRGPRGAWPRWCRHRGGQTTAAQPPHCGQHPSRTRSLLPGSEF